MTDLVGGMAIDAPESSDALPKSAPARPSRARLIIACTLLAFIGGLAAMAWIMTHWQGGLRFGSAATDPAAIATAGNAMDNGAQPSDPTMDMPASTGSTRAPSVVLTPDQQDLRMADLETRMTRIAVAAQAASGYANRAEAMMTAFAARRALDAGQPLGYVAGQLRLLFGDAQPKAVATIVNAAEQPVTLAALRAGLETIDEAEQRGSPGESWWSGAMRELRGLAIIRRAGSPSPEPRQRLARARLNVEAGQMEAAINEISSLPQRPETALWLEQARRYNEAHRALDVIEAAALLEPRTAPIMAPAPQPAMPTQAAPNR
ncbi:MAG: hypothetical protein J0I80_16880 [Sphingomonas sp.]|nr:hypothetical protein [Sphingomonas sp.]